MYKLLVLHLQRRDEEGLGRGYVYDKTWTNYTPENLYRIIDIVKRRNQPEGGGYDYSTDGGV
jgi:hypothetical protein